MVFLCRGSRLRYGASLSEPWCRRGRYHPARLAGLAHRHLPFLARSGPCHRCVGAGPCRRIWQRPLKPLSGSSLCRCSPLAQCCFLGRGNAPAPQPGGKHLPWLTGARQDAQTTPTEAPDILVQGCMLTGCAECRSGIRQPGALPVFRPAQLTSVPPRCCVSGSTGQHIQCKKELLAAFARRGSQ